MRPVVFGLAVAIPATLIEAYVRSRIEELEVEMRSAALQLENFLLLYQNDRGKPRTCSAT
jgi:biopolymer transport protein ExbB/TolQ